MDSELPRPLPRLPARLLPAVLALLLSIWGGIAVVMAATSVDDDRSGDPARQRRQRQQMVDEQIRARGVTSPRVLAAMEQVPRHLFVPESERGQAYEDHP